MDEAQLLGQLQQLLEPEIDGDGLTANEWAKRWGVGVHRARRLLRAGIDEGLLELNHAPRRRIDGMLTSTPIYCVLGGGEPCEP